MIIINTETTSYPASGGSSIVTVTYTDTSWEQVCAATTSNTWISVDIVGRQTMNDMSIVNYRVALSPNEGAYRIGSVVFRAEGSGLGVTMVNQGSALFDSKPIYRDTYYEDATRTDLEYSILCNDNAVFFGRAKRSPEDGWLHIKMNDIARNYLSMDIQGLNSSSVVCYHPGGLVNCAIADAEGTPIYQWRFLNQYRGEWSGESQYNMSEPINGHLSPMMKALFTQYNSENDVPSTKYLTFDITSGSGTLRWGSDYPVSVRKNGGAWQGLTTASTITIESNDRLEFKGENQTYFPTGYFESPFIVNGVTFNVSGNIMSMIYGDNFGDAYTLPQDSCFAYFFTELPVVDCGSLVLPATALTNDCYTNMFNNCHNLTVAPQLNALELASGCYAVMFAGCTSLTTAPALPATQLEYGCYGSMFEGCTSLVNAPVLLATQLADDCYDYMFEGCTSLVNAPSLPATQLAEYCYRGMFYGCTSLSAAPQLPAMELEGACYSEMFVGCTSLTSVPNLPATALSESCYAYMFDGCTGIVNEPVLPAETLPMYCYSHMFNGCSGITAITCNATNVSALSCTDNWVSGVAPYGIFTKADGMSGWTIDNVNGTPIGWLVKSHNTMTEENLSFKVTSGGTLTFTHNRTLVSDVGNLTIEYRTNYGSWSSLTTSTGGTTINVSAGNIIEFRGDNAKYGSLPLSYTTLSSSTAQFEAYGNMMSLIDSTNFPTKTDITEQYCFNRFFAGSKITSGRYMVLSTITLPMHCYTSMFQNCTLLTVAPELPNCVMDNSCCNEMYNGCSSLNYIRCYATDISAYHCTYNWVTGVAASGTFVKSASTTWESGNSGIPNNWTVIES